MKIAVIKTGGKQYLVRQGDKLKVEKLAGQIGQNFEFKEVLLIVDDQGEDIEIGRSLVNKAVEAKILSEDKGDKVRVLKYKAKTRYKKVYGHRQLYTEVQIEKIA